MFHRSPRRIEAHIKLCILALQMQRAAEIRCAQPWARIAHELAALKAIRYRAQGRAIVQRTKIPESLGKILKTSAYQRLRRSSRWPSRPPTPPPHRHTPGIRPS